MASSGAWVGISSFPYPAHTVNVINILLVAGLDKMGSHTLLHPTSLLGLLSPKPNPGW